MDLAPLLVSALFVATATLVLQIGDAITVSIDARHVRDDDDPELLTRTRIRELTWTIAITAALATLVAFGADLAVRMLGGFGDVLPSLLVLLGTALLVFAIGVIAVVAIVRRERPTYARIRRDLRDRATLVLEPEQLDEFAARLADADKAVARRSGAAPGLRIVALVLVLGVTLSIGIIASLSDAPGIAAASFAAAALSVAAFIVATRASRVRTSAMNAVLAAQRAEVVALLERARIPQRRKVPGLRERVTKALSILREQQR